MRDAAVKRVAGTEKPGARSVDGWLQDCSALEELLFKAAALSQIALGKRPVDPGYETEASVRWCTASATGSRCSVRRTFICTSFQIFATYLSR
jgi:hypothetical protein